MTQISRKNKIKKEIKINHLNILNYQNGNNNSKLNLNTILKKDSYSKEKQRTVFKNKIKNKYNIISNKNSNIFNKTINGQCLTARTKIKNINGKERRRREEEKRRRREKEKRRRREKEKRRRRREKEKSRRRRKEKRRRRKEEKIIILFIIQ